jgi:hypothetical protein
MPASGDDTDSESQQQAEAAHQSVEAMGPHESEQLGETEVHLQYNLFDGVNTTTDLLARLQAASALI